jgi:hypothetical protein
MLGGDEVEVNVRSRPSAQSQKLPLFLKDGNIPVARQTL